jgi:hypothetical protein
MCAASSDDYFIEQPVTSRFDEIHTMVTAEFDVTEAFVYHDIPTFYVNYKPESKQAFLRLHAQLDKLELVATLKNEDSRVVLQVLKKPPVKPSNKTINIALFFATLGTVFFSGYMISTTITDALLFTAAIMAILGTHEMGHKLLADKHDVAATYPYFIPGYTTNSARWSGYSTKEILNKDALFDIGFTGPIVGFIVAVIVTIIGAQLSTVVPYDPTMEVNSVDSVYPLVYRWILQVLPLNRDGVIMAHPVAYAGWVGMIVTMLNLVQQACLTEATLHGAYLAAKHTKQFHT